MQVTFVVKERTVNPMLNPESSTHRAGESVIRATVVVDGMKTREGRTLNPNPKNPKASTRRAVIQVTLVVEGITRNPMSNDIKKNILYLVNAIVLGFSGFGFRVRPSLVLIPSTTPVTCVTASPALCVELLGFRIWFSVLPPTTRVTTQTQKS